MDILTIPDFYEFSVGAHQKLSLCNLLLIKFQVRDRVIYMREDGSMPDDPQSRAYTHYINNLDPSPTQILNKIETSRIISKHGHSADHSSDFIRHGSEIYTRPLSLYNLQGRFTGILVELILGTAEEYEDAYRLTLRVLDLKDGDGRRITRFAAASESVVQSLQKIKWSSGLKEKCAICLRDFSVDSASCAMKCSHLAVHPPTSSASIGLKYDQMIF